MVLVNIILYEVGGNRIMHQSLEDVDSRTLPELGNVVSFGEYRWRVASRTIEGDRPLRYSFVRYIIRDV